MSDHSNEILGELADGSYRKKLIKALINELEVIGEVVEYNAHDYVLKTGEKNEELFFLIQGHVHILVGGEQVASLDKQGDLVGEMSLVSTGICTADVMAVTTTKMLKIAIDHLQKEVPQSELLLYKILCLTLVDKLDRTNVKAKNFEILNRSLQDEIQKRTQELQDKNDVLTLGYQKLDSMYQQNKVLLQELSRIDGQYLTQDILKIKGDQESLTKQKVLVIEPNSKQRNLLKIALGGTGVEVEFASTEEAVTSILQNMTFQIVLLSSAMVELVDYLHKHNPDMKIVLLAESSFDSLLVKMAKNKIISNLIFRKEDDKAFNIKSIISTISKMTTGNIFGIDKYLNWGVEIKEFDLNDSSMRNTLNEEVIGQLEKIGIRSTVREKCRIVIEELLMNAIYDAPVDTEGKSLYNHLSRQEKIVLSEGQTIKLKYATDGVYLAVSVIDPFGSFSKDVLLNYLEKNYVNLSGSDTQDVGKGGAGKGLYMITQNSHIVIFNIQPGVQTEVISLFEIDTKAETSGTSLHYFQKD
jgi:CRP-like cAMP-binding protein/CheY-like chemotaxis protein